MTPNSRKSAPALYELVGSGRPKADPTQVRPREISPERAVEAPMPAPQLEGEIAPGGSVRVPAGGIFLIVFGVFAALFVGYLIGYQQKSREVTRDASQERVNALELPRDPLNDRPINPDLVRDTPPVADRDLPSGVRPTPEQAPPVVEPAPEGPTVDGPIFVEGRTPDPRTRGLNYLAFTSESRERIEPFLTYLDANGVDAAAYPVNNGVYRVYALRGFRGGDYLDPQGVSFENEIRALTEAFADGQGRTLRFSRLWERF